MNKKIVLLVAFFALVTNIYGQRRPDEEKIKTLKVAFFTEKLDLSSSEAEAFWPVYNSHESKMNSYRKTERSEFRGKLKNLDAMSDKEAEILLEKYMDLKSKKHKERQSFVEEMKDLISPKKIVLLLKTEEDFKRQLLKQYRQKRSGGGGDR